MLPELSQNFSEVFKVVLWVGKINKDIFKEHQDEFVQVFTEKIVHDIQELGRTVRDAKWHAQNC